MYSIFCLNICLCTVCAVPMESREGIRIPLELEFYIDGCEPLCGYWVLNPGLLEQKSVLLTTESSL